jgi:carboxypeptidase Q
MKRLLILAIIFLPNLAAAVKQDSLVLRRIRSEIMLHGTCYDNLRVLTKQVGHRLSGSPQAAKAVEWAVAALREAGADTVWKQPVYVPHWVRGKESLRVKLAGGTAFEPLKMLSLGNAVGTDGKMVEAPIVMVQTIDEFKKLDAAAVKGKIVFFNYRFRQDMVNTFEGYGDAIKYRGSTPALVGAAGGLAVIIRSLSTGLDDAPHTGTTRYTDTVRKIPAVSLGNSGADKLEAACRKGTVTAQLTTSCKMLDSVLSYNVIGEIKGSESPDEYIVVGGHLDSWDVGEGAHDDGAGCVQSIEVIRTFKAAHLSPKRSIRAVMYMNEENGSRGGRAYADSAKARREKHILAMESDAGGFSPRGIGLEMKPEQKEKIRGWAPLFAPLNVYDFSQEEGGVDIGPLANLGTPLAGLLPDMQRYFDYHHTEQDVFEAVNHRELKLGAAVMASLVYLVSTYGL